MPDLVVGTSVRRLRILALVGTGVLVTTYLVFVLTAVGQAIGDAAYLGRLAESKALLVFDKGFLSAIDLKVFLCAALILVIVAAFRRQWLAAVAIAIAYAASILTAEALKFILPRPILAADYENLMGSKDGLNTFPSGHATFITALVLGLIFLVPVRARVGVAIGGLTMVILVTGSVVLAGWHRPSDAVGGIALALTCQSLAAAWVLRRRGVPVTGPVSVRALPCAGALIAALATVTLVLSVSHPKVEGLAALIAVEVLIFAWAVTAVTLVTGALSTVDLRAAASISRRPHP
ncbi:MAG: phosphatase PAP2 family protein [Actinomycetota bacterium]|nr:phosphatase PAP2 family protein [Actinomycetota bacterium]